jgi:AcrR family transcriptional regulator
LSENDRVDRRVRRTRFAVPNALFELMLEKEYDDITVADIAERADIVRSTFYMHYAGKEDVLQTGVDAVRDWAARMAPPGRRFGFSEPLYRHCCDVRPVLRTFAGRQSWALMQSLFTRILGELIRADLRAVPGERDEAAVDALVHVVTAAWLAVLTWSLESATDIDAAEMDRIFRTFALPGADAVLAAAARAPAR